MEGQGKKPPDKGESNEVSLNHKPFRDDLFSSDTDIKQEPIVKEERIDTYDNVVSISYASTTTGPLSNSIRVVQMTGSTDFNNLCDLTDNKLAVKVEDLMKKVEKVPNVSSGKDEAGVKLIKKPTFGGKKADSKSTSGNRKKSAVTNVLKGRQPNGKEKQFKVNPDKKPHQCSSCEYTTSDKSNLKRHTRKHTGEKPFQCTHCSKRFSESTHLQHHMRTHVAEFMFSCANCLKGFSQMNEKLEHEEICNVPRYECDLCNEYSTLIKTHLKNHMRVHTGDRPFRCDQCLKKFTRQSHLNRHMKTHTNPRPPTFKCSICYMNFAQETKKDEHEGKCKKHGFECYLCKCYNSSNKSHLVYHMRAQHTGDKPFRCEICAKRFLHKGHLNQHKKIHK